MTLLLTQATFSPLLCHLRHRYYCLSGEAGWLLLRAFNFLAEEHSDIIHRVTDRVTCWSGVGAIRLTSMGASSSELYSSPSIVLEYKDECVRSDVFSDWPVMNDTGCSPGGSFLC